MTISAIASQYAVARSGLLANQIALDVVANNIANANTTAFRSDVVLFSEAIDGALRQWVEEDTRRYQGVRVTDVSAHTVPGVLNPSESPWHLAIDGPGFFQVQLPDGAIAYTRDGRFQVSSDMRLVTADGYRVVGVPALPAAARGFVINAGGGILAEFVHDEEGRVEVELVPVGEIPLVGFMSPQHLHRIGRNLHLPTEGSGPALPVRGNGAPWGELISRALEGSNTDLSLAMMDLIIAQRSYALSARTLQTVDEMASYANELGR